MTRTKTCPEQRFWSKVQKSDDCWLWVAGRSGSGYGQFFDGDRVVYAHRFSYGMNVGPIPDGLTLDHLCRTPLCVRPDHLEPVMLAVNTRRGNSPAGINSRKTHCKHGHEFTPENTYVYASGGRACRICHKNQERQRKLCGVLGREILAVSL